VPVTEPEGNPLRDFDDGRFAAWVEELDDVEAIELMSRVSADLKRRNLLSLPEGEDSEKAIREVVDAIVGPRT